MKAIIQYKSEDGKIFNSEGECEKHESLVEKLALAMTPLGPESKAVSDGKGWVQHDPANVSKAKKFILQLARPIFAGNYPKITEAIDNNPDSIHPGSIVGRILDDMDTPVNDGWRRLYRIDSQGREHQQPYYAINGPLPSHVCVEDRR